MNGYGTTTGGRRMRRSWALVGILIVSSALGVALPARAVSLTYVTIDVPGMMALGALGINAAGQIVGNFTDASRKLHGYLRTTEGTFTMIDAPGAIGTNATGINAAGQIVGYFEDAGGAIHGYLRTAEGTFTTIDVPGATGTAAVGISAAGQIVGDFTDAGADHTVHGYVATPTQ